MTTPATTDRLDPRPGRARHRVSHDNATMAGPGVRTGAAGARIAAEIREAILTGRYGPGDRIRQEDLADRHGASRLPVRDALRMLEGEGLITVVPNTGAWVSRLELAECQEMYQIRERIEPLLLRYSMPYLIPQDVDEFRSLVAAMEATDDVEEFVALDRRFHLGTYKRAHTSLLGETVLRLWNRTQHYRRAYSRMFAAEGDRSVHHEHHLLVHALARGDTESAEQVLAGHIRRTRIELSRHPELFV
jgi:DNA-binding GntR family transcriptional regulator